MITSGRDHRWDVIRLQVLFESLQALTVCFFVCMFVCVCICTSTHVSFVVVYVGGGWGVLRWFGGG